MTYRIENLHGRVLFDGREFRTMTDAASFLSAHLASVYGHDSPEGWAAIDGFYIEAVPCPF